MKPRKISFMAACVLRFLRKWEYSHSPTATDVRKFLKSDSNVVKNILRTLTDGGYIKQELENENQAKVEMRRARLLISLTEEGDAAFCELDNLWEMASELATA